VKIACDACIAQAAIWALELDGHKVVYQAKSEADEQWFPEAVDAGAELFVTHDFDIVTMAINRGLLALIIPAGIRGKDQASVVLEYITTGKEPEFITEKPRYSHCLYSKRSLRYRRRLM